MCRSFLALWPSHFRLHARDGRGAGHARESVERSDEFAVPGFDDENAPLGAERDL
jgi:hypothetical protein